MARTRKPANPSAENALDSFKMEVASELGIADKVRSSGWQNMSSADCGRVGGTMVRRMIEAYESKLAGTSATSVDTSNVMTAKFDVNKQP
jgi:small acid-soluble spore protein D (minor alpha/beta-type SASP)